MKFGFLSQRYCLTLLFSTWFAVIITALIIVCMRLLFASQRILQPLEQILEDF